MRWQIFRASDGDTVKVQPYDKSMKNIVPKVGEVPHESGRPSVGVCSLQRVTSGMVRLLHLPDPTTEKTFKSICFQ